MDRPEAPAGPARDAPGPPSGPWPSGGAPDRLVLASWWMRGAALVLDTLVLTPLFVIAVLVVGVGDEGTSFEDALSFGGSTEGLVLSIVAAAAFALYTTVSLALWGGRTVGKHALGIRVVQEDGDAPGWRTAAIRQVPLQAVVATVLPFFGLADYLWPLFDRENRALHDMLARTRVVRSDG